MSKLQKLKKTCKYSYCIIINVFILTVVFSLYFISKYNTMFSDKLSDIIICTSITISLIVSQLYTRIYIRRANDRDVLTGLLSKQRLFHDMYKLVNAKYQFYVLFIDCNNFKMINDKKGHLKGDLLLNKFSENLRNISSTTISYRYGGDEFVVLMDCDDFDTNLDKIVAIQNLVELSFAYGYTKYDLDKTNLKLPTFTVVNELLEDADREMYKNKSTYHS